MREGGVPAPPRGSSGASTGQMCLNPTVVAQLLRQVDARLHPTWDWLLSLMDSTEAQLRYIYF